MIEDNTPKLPDNLKDKDVEAEIYKTINKKKFFEIMNMNSIDFEKVILKKKSYNKDFHKFNYLIKKLVNETDITFIECAIYLHTDFFKEKAVFDCFNEENYHELRAEFAEKYDFNMDSNILKNFIKWTKKK
jgi:hypothetical protein